MKRALRILLALTMVSLTATVNAQPPTWQWARGVGNTFEYGRSISTDAHGNSYVTGYFLSPAITFGTFTLTNANSSGKSYDLFVVKYDASGNVVWAKSAGGSADDLGTSICIDQDGNCFITGYYQSSTIAFGNDITLTHTDNFFIVKYDVSGTPLWAKTATGNRYDAGTAVNTDAGGNVYVTGTFSSDSVRFGNTSVKNAGSSFHTIDIFIVKYSPDGNVLWAKGIGGTEDDVVASICADESGNCYLTGYYLSSQFFIGNLKLNALTGAGSRIFLIKYSDSGNPVWARSDANSSNAAKQGNSVATSGSSVFVTGAFNSPSLSFGSITLTNANLTGTIADFFIVKYDTSGTPLWAKSAGTNSLEVGVAVTADARGTCYVVGYFQNTSITFGSFTLTNTAGQEIFIVKYDASGNAVWATNAGGTGEETGYGISLDAGGTCYITGSYKSIDVRFGGIPLTNKAGVNHPNFFIAALGGVSEVSYDNSAPDLNAYPNPFTFQTTLRTIGSFRNASLAVYNAYGAVVKDLRNPEGLTITLMRDDLPCGVYYIRLVQDDKTYTVRAVVVSD